MKDKVMTCEIISMPASHVVVNLAKLLIAAGIRQNDEVEIVCMKNQITILNVNKKGKK